MNRNIRAHVLGKKWICFLLIIGFCLCFVDGCAGNQGRSRNTVSSKAMQQKSDSSQAFTADELRSISKSGTVSLVDDSRTAKLWVPQNEKTTLSKIKSWFAHAKKYKGQIPRSQLSGKINANVAPSILYITISDQHKITLQPAFYLIPNGFSFTVCYVDDVLKLTNDGKTGYIQSDQLYRWLKEDKWEKEFKEK